MTTPWSVSLRPNTEGHLSSSVSSSAKNGTHADNWSLGPRIGTLAATAFLAIGASFTATAIPTYPERLTRTVAISSNVSRRRLKGVRISRSQARQLALEVMEEAIRRTQEADEKEALFLGRLLGDEN